ncbi:MAG: hypothetical protein Q7T26_11545 [Dehalococcoidia bacterium]|nr:hypothetical protein [Dehalococcoidia bacterium]
MSFEVVLEFIGYLIRKTALWLATVVAFGIIKLIPRIYFEDVLLQWFKDVVLRGRWSMFEPAATIFVQWILPFLLAFVFAWLVWKYAWKGGREKLANELGLHHAKGNATKGLADYEVAAKKVIARMPLIWVTEIPTFASFANGLATCEAQVGQYLDKGDHSSKNAQRIISQAARLTRQYADHLDLQIPIWEKQAKNVTDGTAAWGDWLVSTASVPHSEIRAFKNLNRILMRWSELAGKGCTIFGEQLNDLTVLDTSQDTKNGRGRIKEALRRLAAIMETVKTSCECTLSKLEDVH